MNEPLKILIIDDSKLFWLYLRKTIADNGIKADITEVLDIASGMAALKSEVFDCVFLDYILPDGYGISVLQEIRATGIKTPVIVLTGQGDEQVAVKMMKAGASDYIPKSQISPDRIGQSVRNVIYARLLEQHIEHVEGELKKTKDFFDNIVKTSKSLIIELDINGRVLFINAHCERIIGWKCEDAIGKSWSDIFIPVSFQSRTKKILKRLIEQKEGIEYKGLILTRDGKERVIDWIFSTLLDSSGSVSLIQGAGVDVTDRKRADEEIRESEKKYRSIFEGSIDVVYITNKEGYFIDINPAASKLFGYSLDEFRSMNIKDLYLDPSKRSAYLEEMENKGFVKDYLLELKKKDGKVIDLILTATVSKNRDGQVKFQGMMRDITEKKRAEEALKEANAQISQLLTSISSILIGLSKKGIINQWNSTAEKTFGIATADAIGKHFLQCGIVWDSNIVVENLNKCKAKNVPIHLDIWYIRPDGQEGLLDLQFNYIEDDSKKHRGYVLLGKDITEKKRIESQIALSQKLESIGQLAAGIAHEINTPMQYIGDNTRFLEDAFKDIISVLQEYKNIFAKFENSQVSIHLFEKVKTKEKDFDLEYLADEVPKAIEQSLEGIERVRTLILAMKNFSHPGSSEKMFSDINKGIQGTIIISKNEWKYVAEIETILDPDLPLVNCAIDQINQVILSMIINSSQAIKDVIGNNSALKGKIVIETKYEDPFVNIIISDSGKGIPQSIMHKIFDPFFTTKDVGKGTGQGLAIAYDIIINKHNGSIDVYSELEKGTTFIIQFPVGN